MSRRDHLGGVIHTYQKYDPLTFPSPTQPPPDLVSAAFERMLEEGERREFTDEELASMVRIDPSQIGGMIANIDFLRQKLKDRKKQILETYETDKVVREAGKEFRSRAADLRPPKALERDYREAVKDEQLYELENLYYRAGREDREFIRKLPGLVQALGDKYQVDELAAKYEFTGRQPMTVPEALEIKAELEELDKLLEQLDQVQKTGQLGYIDLDELQEYLDQEGMEHLRELNEAIERYIRRQAEEQGLERTESGEYRMTPKALRLFQSKVLTTIFSDLQASRTGRHPDAVVGEGAVESPRTKAYEFGDSVAHMDIPGSLVNAMLREGATDGRVRMRPDDIVVHETKNTPRAATCVLLDMSGSMGNSGLYVNVKRMGLALDGLIRSEYPGDFLQFIEMYTFAKPRHLSEVAELMPKVVTIHSPVVRQVADMANPKMTESDVHWHFTNIQHALQTARRYLAAQGTPNKQVMLVTDGLPTAHFEGSKLFLLYPPDPRTEEATLREAKLCAREGITINIFLLSTWSQTEDDIRFARTMAESTKGRVIYSAGRSLERFVVWDYIQRRKSIVS
ncbi:MAG: hypothetical protein JNK93_11985 [Planctomycetia bacterium]|nr:hypothetical protein [Planctomycetia bacterium]